MDVKSRNPFEVLRDDDSDAPAAAPLSEKLSSNKAASKTSPQQAASSSATDKSRAQPGENSSRSRTDYPRRGGANAGRGNRGVSDGQQTDRPPRFSGPRGGINSNGIAGEEGGRPYRERKSNENWDGPSGDSQDGGGRGRGRGGYRGGSRGGRGREYDRRSGRNEMDSEKKEVAGKGAWGDPVTSETGGEHVEGLPAEEALATVNIDNNAGETTEGAAPTTEEGAAASAEPKEPELEDKYKSLQDFMKEQAEKKASLAATVSRKANEGADTSQWKDTVVFQRNEEHDVFIALGHAKSKKASAAAAKEKVQVDLNITFNEGNARRGGRGDYRGRGRGDRGGSGDRNGPRPGGSGEKGRGGPQVHLNDANAFPSLGAKA